MEKKKEHGVEALNQEYKRYEQVEKNQAYHLAEQETDEEFDDELVIKSCDMGQFIRGG